MPYVRDSMWKGRDWVDLAGMQQGAFTWCIDVANPRSHRSLDGASPISVFDATERSALAALPVAPYAGSAGVDPAVAHWRVLTQDITLARTLERWGAQAGYRVKWDARRNFLIGAPDSVEGTFETALKAILNSAGIRQSDYPLEACIYANTPPLVRITRQGEQARECDTQ